jgi:hypothetical protein
VVFTWTARTPEVNFAFNDCVRQWNTDRTDLGLYLSVYEMKISISGFLHFLKIWSFPIIKIQTLLKNSNQKFVNFAIKVRFFDYLFFDYPDIPSRGHEWCSMTQCDLSICKHYENHSFVFVELGFLRDFEENSNESTLCRHRFQCIDTI